MNYLKILTPLKMGNTTIILSKADKDKLVKGQNEKKIEMPFIAEKEMNAGGGMISNIDDMLKYLDFHLNSDSDVAAISHTRQLYAKPNDYHEGLFWQLKTEMNKPVLHQYGGSYGTYSYLTIIPEIKTGVFIVTNSSGPDVHRILEETADKIFDLMN